MTEEIKRQIAAEYSDKTNKAKDIANKYGISGTTLAKIVLEQGGGA